MPDTPPQLPPPVSDAPTARLLADLARRVASSLDLQQTLQLVVQAVVDQLGFGAALVNMVRPGDLCEVVAVAGPEEASTSLLGTRAPMENWRALPFFGALFRSTRMLTASFLRMTAR